MLDAHPQLCIPPETYFVPELLAACKPGQAEPQDVLAILTASRRWSDFKLDPQAVRDRLPAQGPVGGAEAVRAFYGAYAHRAGKSRWGDKTPVYLKHMQRIDKALAEAHFVHIIRDGRDVALSVTGLMFGPDSVEEAARRWKRKVTRARARAARLDHYLEVRYEDLVLTPDATLRQVCEFIDLPWHPPHARLPPRCRRAHAGDRAQPRAPGPSFDPAGYGPRIHALTSEPPSEHRVGRWRREMSTEDRSTYERVAGDVLAALGYDLRPGSTTPASILGWMPGDQPTS